MTQKNRKLEEDDIVLCTVKRIEGATVFLEIEGNGEGSMTLSEVAAGRIRNLRQYVTPNKKVVCKILRIKGNHIDLSLRRVTAGERQALLARNKKAKVLKNMLKTVLESKTSEVVEKIEEEYELADFLDDARENPKLIEKFTTSAQAKQLEKIFADKKDTEKEVRETITVKSKSPQGILDIQEALNIKDNQTKITYEGSSKFTIAVKDKNFKAANAHLQEILEQIKKKAKELNINLEIKDKK